MSFIQSLGRAWQSRKIKSYRISDCIAANIVLEAAHCQGAKMRGTTSITSEAHSGIGETLPIQRANSLAEDVYEAIFGQLMALKIAPGSRITVDNLVREL